MQVISPDTPVISTLPGYQIFYHPFARYIVSDYECHALVNTARQVRWEISSFNPYERRYGGQDLKGKRVAIYRHTAFGDQLMMSCLPRYLKTLYPTCTIGYYCSPEMCDLWRGNPFVDNSALPLPIPFDVARSYDYHIFFEGMLENNGEHDQNCCYDDFFGFVGLNDVPSQYKRPFVAPLPEDYCRAKDLQDFVRGTPYMVYHLTPANRNRCYPPKNGFKFIQMFLRDKPDWKVLIVGKNSEDYLRDLPWGMVDHPRVMNAVNKTNNFRDMIPILEKADLLVAPDSSVMHMAASFHTPTISLWGLFHPHDRVAYYPNHHALTSFEACPSAPCHNHEFELPKHDCKKASNWDEGAGYCAALSAIEPERILEKAKEILK